MLTTSTLCFAQFADALEQARAKAGKTFSSRLKAMAVAYVRFAAEHPAHFEVMFSWTPHRPAPPSPAGARAFGILEQTIREGQQSGDVRPGDSTVLARLVLGGGSWSQHAAPCSGLESKRCRHAVR